MEALITAVASGSGYPQRLPCGSRKTPEGLRADDQHDVQDVRRAVQAKPVHGHRVKQAGKRAKDGPSGGGFLSSYVLSDALLKKGGHRKLREMRQTHICKQRYVSVAILAKLN